MDIIRQQQRQIDELSRKVDELQKQGAVDAGQADQAPNLAVPEQAKADQPSKHAAVDTAAKAGNDGAVFKWGPSPTIMSKDGDWSVQVTGKLFVDGGVLDDDDGVYGTDNATELRAARLGIEGNFLDGWRFRLENDFADDGVDLKDAYIEYGGALVEPAYVRVGQQKTPNSLEWLTSNSYLTFMERSAIINAFDLDWQIGLGSGIGGDNWGVDAGLFGQNASEQANDEGFAISTRGHYAFLLGPQDSGDALHVGASVRYRDLDNDVDDSEVRYRQRPFFHFTTTRSVDTGTISDAESDLWTGAELAWVHGPLALQGEVANTALQRDSGQRDAANLWGGYFSASYFLTDAMRNYDPKSGAFGRVKVDNPLHEGGVGAWELAARLDSIDLDDSGVRGGEQYSTIWGVNSYLNDYVRLMLDGAWTRVDNARGSNAAVTGSSNDIFAIGQSCPGRLVSAHDTVTTDLRARSVHPEPHAMLDSMGPTSPTKGES